MIYKFINKILFFIVVIFLPLTILLSCVNIVTYDINHYKGQYDRFNITEEIGISENELLIATENLLEYIKDIRNDIDFKSVIKGEEVEFFSSRDKLHMIDVKKIFKLVNKMRNSLAIFLVLILVLINFNKKYEVNIGKCLVFSSVLGIIPFLLLIILIIIDFNKYFTVFHIIFFNNDLWLLDPSIDRLVNIFPEDFFAYTATKILIYYFSALIILFVLGIFKTLNNKKKSILS